MKPVSPTMPSSRWPEMDSTMVLRCLRLTRLPEME